MFTVLIGTLAGANSQQCAELFQTAPDSESATIKHLIDLGFNESVAERLVNNEPQLLDYLQPGSTQSPPIPRATVVDSARGFRRTFTPADMRGSSSRVVVLYRGIKKSFIEGPLRYDAEYFKSDIFDWVGRVVWVTPDFEEARAYAVRDRSPGSNYIFEFHVPDFIYYERNEKEGFLMPDQFRDLRNYLNGIYEVKESEASRKTDAEDFYNWYRQLDTEFIPYEHLPTELRGEDYRLL